MSDRESVLPGQDTLIACWTALANASPGATVTVFPESIAAVFPAWAPLNNAIMRRVAPGRASDEATRLARIYGAAGIDTWALWLPTTVTTLDSNDELALTGLERDTTTLVMTTELRSSLRQHDGVVRTSVASAVLAGDAAVAVAGVEVSEGAPGLSGWVFVDEGFAVAGLWAFRHGYDCGIYGVGTVPERRRRGLARALVEHVLADAAQQGAHTASLQSTAMGLPLYESLGFIPVGRYEEWLWASAGLDQEVRIAE
jgi:GNAT superfamily N-acetyltransferase